jgi:hypothetical protein
MECFITWMEKFEEYGWVNTVRFIRRKLRFRMVVPNQRTKALTKNCWIVVTIQALFVRPIQIGRMSLLRLAIDSILPIAIGSEIRFVLLDYHLDENI